MNLTTLPAGTYAAPAKLNLFLHITGRRPDGYHLLQTAFRLIDYGDALHFTPRADGLIELATPLPGVAPENDLTVRAARLLRAHCGTTQGATIAIDKRLPMGGGLGGGSSDAATTLMALNALWHCGLHEQQLKALGLKLGADVPIFIHGRNAFAEGIGERFYDLELPPAAYLVTVPEVAVPTAAIFGAPELERATPAIAPQDWRPGFGRNTLEAVVTRRYPEVAHHLALLRQLAPEARMSGSGACCFAEFATWHDALAAQDKLPPDLRSFVARGLAQHPLRLTPCQRG